jgi:hypothetical protein
MVHLRPQYSNSYLKRLSQNAVKKSGTSITTRAYVLGREGPRKAFLVRPRASGYVKIFKSI